MSATLVIGPAWVGDMVMAQSLFRLLRAQEPDVAIDVVGPPWSVPLVGRMPEVRRGIALPVAHGEFGFGARRALGKSLRAAGYARAIVIPRSFKSALVQWFARIPVRTGFAAELRGLLLNDARELDRQVLDQTVKRFLALGVSPGAVIPDPAQPVLRVDEDNRATLMRRLGLGNRPAVALMPGAAYGPAKQWPISNFAALAGLLSGRGHDVWVLGSAGERALGEQIRSGAASGADAGVFNLCGQTSLEDTVDLLSAAGVAVTNDSGLMHVAAAAGTHVVAIYGSSSPDFTPPLTVHKTVLYRGLACSPCFRRECPLGHLNCLREITPPTVLDACSQRERYRTLVI
ncbi:MAG: lipopolysaccharide heptosyltransferase II [Gammaproteobacteria bacterium]|nr:lipopolysaccharide heptosyltransferase II [Gammaproteobacteria bacterium]